MTALDLARTDFGDGSAPPVLIAHGLFGSARNWSAIARRLSDRGRVVAVDMRNHGDSPWCARHDYTAMAEDLGALADGWDIMGHSMGGKAAMVLALTWPERVRRLIVADIAPAAYDHTNTHLIRAMRRLDLSGISLRSEADAQLSQDIGDNSVRAFLLQSLDVRNRCWRLNLDALEANMNRIAGWPEIEGRFGGPTLFLSGGDSDYVRPEHRERIRALFPKARFASMPGCGHWLHAEKPRDFEANARGFLDAD